MSAMISGGRESKGTAALWAVIAAFSDARALARVCIYISVWVLCGEPPRARLAPHLSQTSTSVGFFFSRLWKRILLVERIYNKTLPRRRKESMRRSLAAHEEAHGESSL